MILKVSVIIYHWIYHSASVEAHLEKIMIKFELEFVKIMLYIIQIFP